MSDGHKKHSDELSGFFRFVKDFRILLLYVLGFGSAPLVLEYLFHVGPPWPHSAAIAAFTSVAIWLVLFFVYSSWDTVSSWGLRRLVRWGVGFSGVAFCAYIVATVVLMRPAPDFEHREAIGIVLRPSIKLALEKNPDMSVDDLFEGAEYRPERIWEQWSVSVARATFLLMWVVFFGSLAFVISVFVLLQYSKGHEVS